MILLGADTFDALNMLIKKHILNRIQVQSL